jgi:ribonuclease Z
MISIYSLHGVASLSTSTMINWEGNRLILDTGPGTITEIWRRGLRLRGLSAILISHGHLDHLWGLPPLLWFLDQRDWQQEIQIIYPPGIKRTINQLIKISGEPTFLKLSPLSPDSTPCFSDKLTIHAFSVNHHGPSCGFIITEPPKRRLDTEKLVANGISQRHWSAIAHGKNPMIKSKRVDSTQYHLTPRQRKIVYTGDTGPFTHLVEKVKDADLLIIDASWVYPQWEPPEEAPHLTIRQALEIAHQGHVARVLLTHLTTRLSHDEYKKAISELHKEFPHSMSIYLPNEEKIEIT